MSATLSILTASYYEHDEFADHVENAENGQK